MATPAVKLTVGEKLGMVGAIGLTLVKVAFTALRHFVLPPADSPGPARAAYAMLFRSAALLSSRQEQSLPIVPTGHVIKEHCTKFQLLYSADELSNGGIVHWIGPKPLIGQKVLLLIHGGGYNMPASPGHVIFGIKCAMSQYASLVMLEYSLAPKAHYPTQSHQAIEAVRHILKGVPASNLTIMGDSAGAHLTLCVLSHINHPLPDIEPLILSEKLGGLCVISPFLSFDYNKKSYIYNRDRDMLTLIAVKKFNSTFKSPGLSDAEAVLNPRLSPLDAPKGWFKDSPVKRFMLTMGEREVMADDIVAFNERLEKELGRDTDYEFIAGQREVHSAPLLDSSFGLQERDTAKAILAWMSQGI